MAGSVVRERLAQDLGVWLTDGLISKETHDLLRERYAARNFGIAQAVKYVGIAGGLFAFFGLLGLVGALSKSLVVGSMLLLLVGGGLTYAGIRLSTDKLDRYPGSSKMGLMLGCVTVTCGLGMFVTAIGLREEWMVFITGFLVLPAALFVAYRFQNIFILILAVLGFFHWVGSWTSMFGRSSYELAIQDPRLMTAAALVVAAVGVFHELRLREKTHRFFQAYEAASLVYLNLALLILTFDGREAWGPTQVWMVIFFLAAVGQIVAGARLHNALFTALGVTAFALNLYTRYFELFWHRAHEGVFFLLGGASLFGVGLACEYFLRHRRTA